MTVLLTTRTAEQCLKLLHKNRTKNGNSTYTQWMIPAFSLLVWHIHSQHSVLTVWTVHVDSNFGLCVDVVQVCKRSRCCTLVFPQYVIVVLCPDFCCSWLSVRDRTPGLKLVGVPFAPALHLQLERSSGSRDSDMQLLRSIVDYVSHTHFHFS